MNNNRIGVIGIGRLGLSFALLCEQSGYEVVGYDVRQNYLDSLRDKSFSSPEPLVNEYLQASTHLMVTDQLSELVELCDTIFCFVQTPSAEDGSYNHVHIDNVVDDLSKLCYSGVSLMNKIFVVGCTTMPGYCSQLTDRLDDFRMHLIYNPEFIAQGSIIRNLKEADMVLMGSDTGRGIVSLESIYRSIMTIPLKNHVMSTTAAEITKISINCFLTMKIAYANMIGEVAIATGVEEEVSAILRAIGDDSRIGYKFLGYGFGYGGPCVLPTQDIITSRGVIQIKDIKVGDFVISHTGVFNRVTEVFKTPYNGIMHKFKLEGYGKDELIITPDHPIYACQKLGPRYYQTGGKQKLVSMTDKHHDKLKISFIAAGKLQHGDLFGIPRVVINSSKKQYIKLYNNRTAKKNKSIEITPDIMRLFGYYLAEGHIGCEREIFFTFHTKEVEFHADVIALMKDCFNLKASFKDKKKENVYAIRASSQVLARYITDTFGKGAMNKKVPYEWLQLSDNHLINLIRGLWYGDGSKSTNIFTYATISKELFTFCKLVLYKIGVAFTSTIVEPRIGGDGVKHNRYYELTIAKRNGIETFNGILPLKAIDMEDIKTTGNKRTTFWKDDVFMYHVRKRDDVQYNGYVYNIEVENDHSYMLTNAMVHNCLPRDMKALDIHADRVGVQNCIQETIDLSNDHHAEFLKEYYMKLNPDTTIPFIFNQLAYKPGTDILTESQYYRLCKDLLDLGYKVNIIESDRIIEQVQDELSIHGERVTYNEAMEGYTI